MLRSNSSYVITPDSFQVSPAIMGLPLARPSRRLMAMLLDLLIVAILVKTAGALLLGLAVAWFAFRMSARVTGTGARPLGRVVRLSIRAFGAFILFLVATSAWSSGARSVRNALKMQVTMASEDGRDSVRLSPWEAVGLGKDVAALQSAGSEEDARRIAGVVVSGFRGTGMEEEQLRGIMEDIADESEQEWMGRAVESALATPAAAADSARPVTADSLARAFAVYTAAGDTAAARGIQPQLASMLARDSLDELGLGFGWTGLYFTAFMALWRGQTPGKKMLGLRVVRLNGQPMTLWMSFERFGGYAAGLVTGLLGFAQVFWDRNRQMIHDKIVETVVVRDRGKPAAPAPAQTPAVAAFAPYPSVRRNG